MGGSIRGPLLLRGPSVVPSFRHRSARPSAGGQFGGDGGYPPPVMNRTGLPSLLQGSFFPDSGFLQVELGPDLLRASGIQPVIIEMRTGPWSLFH